MRKLRLVLLFLLLIAGLKCVQGLLAQSNPLASHADSPTNNADGHSLLSSTETGGYIFKGVLSLGYLLYAVQIWWAVYESKQTIVPNPLPPGGNITLRAVFSDRSVILESWGFVFFSFILATMLPTIFHLREMAGHLEFPSLMYDVTTQILFALILLEFNYLFELRNKSQTFANWTLLILIALGIDLGMWLFLMLTGDPEKSTILSASQGSTTSVFLGLTTFISFLSSALIILFARRLP
jgi:hypothetical protein